MIVCLCRGITDADVRRVLARGATTVTELGASCGAGAECGGCRPVLYRLLVEHRQAATVNSALVTDTRDSNPSVNCNLRARRLP
ncbi:MAG: (2Fe-2S)-binding protein [Deltaproteobacteria bacterium]|nr:(2Fe-2S)-binding protein [Deltaproteobacteria bacterium]